MITTSSVHIPVIDFTPFLTGDAAAQAAIAAAVDHACRHIGFLYAKGVGLPPTLIDRMFQQSRQFFDLPVAVKQSVAWSAASSNRGYVGIERERLDPHKPGDLKEAFNVGKEFDPTVDMTAPFAYMSNTPNQWPADQPEFRETVLAFYDACAVAASYVLQAFAAALQLPTGFFDDKHDQRQFTLRLLHYPPLQDEAKPEQVRAGAHSDYGSVTLLFQDPVGGLEVQTATGEWLAAPPIPDTIVVNTGDLMQRWTNGAFCSTKHRVLIPTDDRAARSRYSIAFFCYPNYDAEIVSTSSPRLASPERSPEPPILAGDYLLQKLQATY